MNIIREDIDELHSVIKLNVEKSDYEQRVNDALNAYKRKANVPGFRPGKVPFGIVKRMYGGSVTFDEINKLVSENITKYISENNLVLLGEPLPNEAQNTIDLNDDGDFVFAFDIALSPEFEVNLAKQGKIPFYKIILTDDMINEEVKNLTAHFGKHEQSSKAGEASVVKGSFIQVDEAGNDMETGITVEDTMFSMSVVKDAEIKAQLLDKAVGESVIFDVKKAFPNDTEISYLLKITREEAESVTGQFKFTISEIIDFKEAELNQELFDKLFGAGNISSQEEMIAKVKKNLEKSLLIESDIRFTTDMRNAITLNIDMRLPEDFLKRWILYSNKENENITEESVESEFPRHIEDLKWQLIKNKIATTYNLKVGPDDMFANAKKAAKLQFLQYGLNNISDEHIEGYAADILKNQQNNKRFFEGALEDKVMEYVKSAVELDEKEISREDFYKLYYIN
ncbi:MAG: trigger factor [Cytophagaceae bacterium]|jgi:trigger factor|nr:trigger factor [Cytophagaceae bacterium]